MALVAGDIGRVAAVLRAIRANGEVAADRLPIRLVLVQGWTAWFDGAAAMAGAVAAAADHLGLDPAGGWSCRRRGSSWLRRRDECCARGEDENQDERTLHGGESSLAAIEPE